MSHKVNQTFLHEGMFGNWKIAIAEVGVGNSNAASIGVLAIQHYRPTIAVFVGVAGGVKDVDLGDVVVATKIYHYDNGKETKEGFFVRPEVQLASHRLEGAIRALRIGGTQKWIDKPSLDSQQNRKPKVYVGPIAAGGTVVAADKGRIAELLKNSYGDTLALEMEGSGFLAAARICSGCDATVIRGISDLLQNKQQADAENWQARAADAAAAVFFGMLDFLDRFNS